MSEPMDVRVGRGASGLKVSVAGGAWFDKCDCFDCANGLSGVSSVQVWRDIPPSEELGACLIINGERLLVTKRELERVKALPPLDEMLRQIAWFQELMDVQRG